MSSLLLALAILVAPTSPASDPPDQRNADTGSGRAFEAMARISEADLDVIIGFDYDDPDASPDSMRAALSRAQSPLRYFGRAGSQSFSDWNLDYGSGFDMLMPHLAQARMLSRVARADASLRMHDGPVSRKAKTCTPVVRTPFRRGASRCQSRSLLMRPWSRGNDSRSSAVPVLR